jgi:competence protein ComEC
MAKRRTSRRKSKQTKIISAVLALIILAASFVYYQFCYKPEEYDIPEGTIEYHFIDVGQGDAELILVDGKAILIDTSTAKERDKLVSYIDKLGIKEFEYIVLTHPDEDHIGSADHIINNYKINNVILSPKEHTTATYERMIEAIEAKAESGEIKEVINPQDMLGESIMVGELELKMLGPIGEFNKTDMNNPSVVMMARWGNTKVLLTGDAETTAEERIIERFGNELKCDVLKLGHHGSHSSTWESGLLDYAKPSIGIISCGEGNKYGHPHTEALDALAEYNVTVYRTDIDGTIVLTSDGTTITKK